MSYLKDLEVNKISFVSRPANKRKFLLLKAATRFTDKPWDGSKSRFTLDQLKRSVPRSVLAWAEKQSKDKNNDVIKSNLKLPFKEPDGTININGVQAALRALAGARTPTQLPSDVKSAARKELENVLERAKKALNKDFDSTNQNQNQNQKGAIIMRNEVKSKLQELLKSADVTQEKVLESLQSDKDLEITEDEIEEVNSMFEIFTVKSDDSINKKDADKKAQDKKDVDKKDADELKLSDDLDPTVKALLTKLDEEKSQLRKELDVQKEKLEKQERASRRTSIRKFLLDECPYLPDDTDKTVDEILKLEDIDADSAEVLKRHLKNTSQTLENSNIFNEFGSSRSVDFVSNDPIAASYMSKINKSEQEMLLKGANGKEGKLDPTKKLDLITNVVKSFGPKRYEEYRRSLHRRSRESNL